MVRRSGIRRVLVLALAVVLVVMLVVSCGGASSTPVDVPPSAPDGGVDVGGGGFEAGTNPAADAGGEADAAGEPGLACDQKSDCGDRFCCAEASDLSDPAPERSLETRCLPTCITGAPRYQVCRQASECESGECSSFDCGPRARGLRFCERPHFCL